MKQQFLVFHGKRCPDVAVKNFFIVEYLKMNTQCQKHPFLVDHSTEILHKHLYVSAFWREDKSNQQLLPF